MKKNIRIIESEIEKKQLISKCASCINVETVKYLTDNKYAHNSVLAMTKDWNLFVEFCMTKHVTSIPASSTALRLFIEREAKQRKYATIKRYVTTISLFHRILGLTDPSAVSSVKLAVSKLRIEKHGDAKPTEALELHHLLKLHEILSVSKNPRNIRNLAIFHIMFDCLAKRGELREFRISDLVSNNDDSFSINIGSNTYLLSKLSCQSIRRWLDIRSVNSPWLFSAIDKHGNVSNDRLNDSSIYRIVRSASELLDINVQFSGQSLRVGAAKELARQGAKVKEVQILGRWISAAMPYQYLGNKALADIERMKFKAFKPIR